MSDPLQRNSENMTKIVISEFMDEAAVETLRAYSRRPPRRNALRAPRRPRGSHFRGQCADCTKPYTSHGRTHRQRREPESRRPPRCRPRQHRSRRLQEARDRSSARHRRQRGLRCGIRPVHRDAATPRTGLFRHGAASGWQVAARSPEPGSRNRRQNDGPHRLRLNRPDHGCASPHRRFRHPRSRRFSPRR